MTAPLDLDALEAAARAATPGPWEQALYVRNNQPDTKIIAGNDHVTDCDGYSASCEQDLANATFIAAANPAVVLELVRRLRAADAWISVDESRPTDHTKCYLVFSNWGIRLARKHEADWANGCFQDVDSDSDEGMFGWDESKGAFTVTHWKELPAEPTQGGNHAHS